MSSFNAKSGESAAGTYEHPKVAAMPNYLGDSAQVAVTDIPVRIGLDTSSRLAVLYARGAPVRYMIGNEDVSASDTGVWLEEADSPHVLWMSESRGYLSVVRAESTDSALEITYLE